MLFEDLMKWNDIIEMRQCFEGVYIFIRILMSNKKKCMYIHKYREKYRYIYRHIYKHIHISIGIKWTVNKGNLEEAIYIY
jgi:hypothetical protein